MGEPEVETRRKRKRTIYVISSSEEEDIPDQESSPSPNKKRKNPTVKSETVDKNKRQTIKSPKSRLQPSCSKSKNIPKMKIPKMTIEIKDEPTMKEYLRKSLSKKEIIKKPVEYFSELSKEKDNKNVRIETLDKKKLELLWQEQDILENEHKISARVARNIVSLFKDGNTIPFIARYRKEAIGQMSPDELRNVKSTFEHALELKQKIVNAYSKIHDMGKMNDKVAKSLLDVRSIETLDEIYSPFKPVDGEASIKRQIHAALEEPANLILEGKFCDLSSYIGKSPGLDSYTEVEKQIVPSLAKKIASSSTTMQFLQKLKKEANCSLHTKKINKRTPKVETNTKHFKQNGKMNGKHKTNKDESNFANYYDRIYSTHQLKPHQIMAINRAEHMKFINVKLEFTDFSHQFYYGARNNWKEAIRGRMASFFEASLQECYNNIVIPLLKRMKRAELKSFAEKASLDIFSGNLKQILLATPVKGRIILGVDPGFAHGCKLAVISDTGSLFATGVVYPHTQDNKRRTYETMFREMLIDHNCSLIALGNGTACRETEAWITEMITRGLFHPLEVSYTIVNESGASVYSCSKEATKEFKTLDPNKISAVSLARRVQEPLAELVKIDPKHLGIGMYQHDVNQKRLEEALAEVVSECVSFVGIDINTASQCLLKYVAGLSDRRATEIITFREENGPFEAREELLKVKGIGPHTFKQCAGFLKILNGNNKLDSTIVHPESYDIAKQIVQELKLRLDQIGDETFIQCIKREQHNLIKNFSKFNTSVENFETILEGLTKPLNYDLRDDGCRKPLFRKGVTNMSALHVDMTLTGCINNVTSFGYFVDIGVGTSGLLHSKNAKGINLQIGDHVEVRVCNLEIDRGRIGLELIQKL